LRWEACATTHYWARELTKLGNHMRLTPAKDVKAYIKKNNVADAEAIRCGAATDHAFRASNQIRRAAEPVNCWIDLLMRQLTQAIKCIGSAYGRTRHLVRPD